MTILHSTERCPEPGCGRRSQIIEGTFDFDAEGFATAISAPEWSVDALTAVQKTLRDLQRVMSNRSVSDDVVDQWISRSAEKIRSQGPAEKADVVASTLEQKLRAVSRNRGARILAGILVVMSQFNTAADFGENVGQVVEQVRSIFDSPDGSADISEHGGSGDGGSGSGSGPSQFT